VSQAAIIADAPRSRRRLWIGLGCAGVLVAGGAVAAVVLASSGSGLRGEISATVAAHHFVAALNSGNKDDAAAVSCDNFADQARSAAASGADPGIDFVLDSVAAGDGSGTAELTQRLRVDGKTQQQPYLVHLQRTDGRWLVCGQV
jgi:hypothetical protein